MMAKVVSSSGTGPALSAAQLLVLPSELTHRQATGCLRMLLQTLKGSTGQSVLLDAGALTRFDSAALAVMLALRRESLSLGRAFGVRGLHPRLAGLAGLYGIGQLLPSEPAPAP